MTQRVAETLFLNMLRAYGPWSIIRGWDFITALALAFLLTASADHTKVVELAPLILGVEATFLTIVLASLAILAALSNLALLRLVRKAGLLPQFLFPFWLVATVLVIGILFSLLLFLVKRDMWLAELVGTCTWIWFTLFLLLYGLFGVLCIIPTIIRFIWYRTFVEEEHTSSGTQT